MLRNKVLIDGRTIDLFLIINRQNLQPTIIYELSLNSVFSLFSSYSNNKTTFMIPYCNGYILLQVNNTVNGYQPRSKFTGIMVLFRNYIL